MCKALAIAVFVIMLSASAQAEREADQKAGLDATGYPGNTSPAEKEEALKLRGRVRAGRDAYEAYCEACHLPDGAGNPDGSIPQLAGQHRTVLIKALADIRSGVRYNPTMYPFARKLPDPQALADVAAYIETLCIPLGSGKYPGPDATQRIAYGKRLYERECIKCHQPNGEGLKDAGYPVLAGQHYGYLLRQMTAVRDGKRVDAPEQMFDAISKYSDPQLVAISAYQASLATPRSMLMPRGSMCRSSAATAGKAQ